MGVFMSLFKRVLSVVWMLMLLASCRGIPVSTDYEPERDYSALKTYAWKEPMRKIIIDPLLDNDLNAWLMGWPRVSVFDGGWFEWSNDDTNPFETGVPKE